MSDLLIPTIGPNNPVSASTEATIAQSERDASSRPFGCTFYLEDTRARTKYVALEVGRNSDFHIKTEQSIVNFYLQFNDTRKLSSVLIGCMAMGKKQALELTLPHMQRLASLWCLKYRRPVSIYSVEVYDKNNHAKWLIPSVTPSTTPLIERPVVTLWDTALTSLVAVFREGMNATAFSHKFLSYFKILEAYPTQGPFKQINAYCKSEGIELPRETKVLTEAALRGAFDATYHSAYLGKKYTRIRDELTDYRNAIAHPFTGDMFLDLDTYEVQAELAAIANMLERMAITVLDEEIQLLAKVSSDDVHKQIAKSYSNVYPE